VIVEARTMPASEEVTGETVFSDELGLSGSPRLLWWTVITDAAAPVTLHVLHDTTDRRVATVDALVAAPYLLGRHLTSGTVRVTRSSIDVAVSLTHPAPFALPKSVTLPYGLEAPLSW
jgi:hypothetical protein